MPTSHRRRGQAQLGVDAPCWVAFLGHPKKRGWKHAGRRNPGILVRLEAKQIAVLDDWIAAQPDPKPSRPGAIRRLLAAALDAKA